MTPKQKKRLNEFYAEARQAEQRMQMAVQTVQGAQADMLAKKTRFEAAVEFVGGAGATWTHNTDDGVVVLEAAKAPPPEPVAQNGAGTSVPHHNREARRTAKKALGK